MKKTICARCGHGATAHMKGNGCAYGSLVKPNIMCRSCLPRAYRYLAGRILASTGAEHPIIGLGLGGCTMTYYDVIDGRDAWADDDLRRYYRKRCGFDPDTGAAL